MMRLERRDWLWILMIATSILIAGSLPTWAGRAAATDQLRFRGLYFDEQDYAVHLAMMQSGLQGEWAYQLRFTSEPHSAVYIRLFYIALGHFSGWLHLPPQQTFELARWLFGYAACISAYCLFRRIYPDRFWARTAFLLGALGSGIGWLQLMGHWVSGEYPPVDLWLIDAYFLFSLSVFPHFAFVTAGMCLALGLWLDYLERPRRGALLLIMLTATLVQFANPIAFAPVDAALAGALLFAWWRDRQIRGREAAALGLLALTQLPLLVYNLVILSRDPVWSQFTAQNQTPSPPPDYYLWGFALFWPLALWGARFALREKKPALGAALAWIIAAFVMAYLPFNIQRRFLHGITIPLAILAGWGLMILFEARAAQSPGLKRWRGAAATGLVILASISTIFLVVGQSLYMQARPAKYFYPAGLEQAAYWLGRNAGPGDFALAAEETSSLLAQIAGLRVYLGHPMETLDYQAKQADVEAFYEGRASASWLEGQPIEWIVYGPYERELDAEFQPSQILQLVYQENDVSVYRVK
jgi:hypothetical protein